MKQDKTKRKSHCSICGKRLSVKTDSGDIQWRPSRVDDSGFYCETCHPPDKNNKKQKNSRT